MALLLHDAGTSLDISPFRILLRRPLRGIFGFRRVLIAQSIKNDGFMHLGPPPFVTGRR